VSKVQITSSTVIGEPSWKRACGRSVKAAQERSSGHSMVSAIKPYSVEASSREFQHSVSQIALMPAAGTLLTMKGWSESKVPRAPSRTLPPLGASGLSQSGGPASAACFGVPCMAKPWLTLTFCDAVCVWARRMAGAPTQRAVVPNNKPRRLIAMRVPEASVIAQYIACPSWAALWPRDQLPFIFGGHAGGLSSRP
jgi:hypothetical protein